MKRNIIFFLSTFGVLFLIYNYKHLIWYENSEQNQQIIEINYTNHKYILLWTSSHTNPFKSMGNGQEIFVKRHCSEINCFITSKKRLLNDVSKFDVILFHGPDLSKVIYLFPKRRSPHQKYVFISLESSTNYPLQHPMYDGIFNWTWSYKLSSDIYFGYIIIKNKQGDIIGPKRVMHWLNLKEMKPIDQKLKERLNSKSKAAAWFVSNCVTQNRRYIYGLTLQRQLANYNLTLDIYGKCGHKQCPRENMADCLRKLEKEYYFYFSFENSFSGDYVTEKVLHALQHYTVPIVYGVANYTRFIPDGSYLNAYTLSMKKLIEQMIDIINNKEKYYDFFRWTNHYTYHKVGETPETDSYCKFCSMINDANLMEQKTIHKQFRNWWNH